MILTTLINEFNQQTLASRSDVYLHMAQTAIAEFRQELSEDTPAELADLQPVLEQVDAYIGRTLQVRYGCDD